MQSQKDANARRSEKFFEEVYRDLYERNKEYEVLVDCMDMNTDGKMEYREQVVVFRKGDIKHWITRL